MSYLWRWWSLFYCSHFFNLRRFGQSLIGLVFRSSRGEIGIISSFLWQLWLSHFLLWELLFLVWTWWFLLVDFLSQKNGLYFLLRLSSLCSERVSVMLSGISWDIMETLIHSKNMEHSLVLALVNLLGSINRCRKMDSGLSSEENFTISCVHLFPISQDHIGCLERDFGLQILLVRHSGQFSSCSWVFSLSKIMKWSCSTWIMSFWGLLSWQLGSTMRRRGKIWQSNIDESLDYFCELLPWKITYNSSICRALLLE